MILSDTKVRMHSRTQVPWRNFLETAKCEENEAPFFARGEKSRIAGIPP